MSRTTVNTADTPRAGVIGLGVMGAPMARHLASTGTRVTAYDPAPSAARAVEGSGVTLVGDGAAVAAAADVLVCMVATPAQARGALLGAGDSPGALDSMRSGSVLVVMGTLGREPVRELAAAAADKGVGFVDAPVSGGVVRAGRGELLIMGSGDDASWAGAWPVLDALGDPVRRVGGEPGQGQVVKLVNQLLCGVHIAAAAEALALAASMGVDVAETWETIRPGAAASFMLDDRGGRMVTRSFDDVRSALDIFVKDMGLVADAAERSGLDAVLASTARRVFEEASERGWGRQDDSGVIRWYEERGV
ncbi:NAD(P)-dependent oxidoreductase [Nocardiopsis sp. NPDC050513]|uniref:NAD(P)-dependent oxidoreductase n=1 Tax=Nocardiopsis sp. NPDC050513 TaxID=3364338 RepID=UPI003791BAC2